MIDIFTQPGCGPCQQVKIVFDKSILVEGVDYRYVDITENDLAKSFVVSQGFKSVPVVLSGDTIIHGYKPYALAEIINEAIREKDAFDWDGETEDGRYLH